MGYVSFNEDLMEAISERLHIITPLVDAPHTTSNRLNYINRVLNEVRTALLESLDLATDPNVNLASRVQQLEDELSDRENRLIIADRRITSLQQELTTKAEQLGLCQSKIAELEQKNSALQMEVGYYRTPKAQTKVKR